MNKNIKKYDDNGNLIYIGFISGYKSWREFDKNNNIIYYKNSDGDGSWYKWSNNKQIEITEKEFENIKIREYNSRTKCSRFELMEI